MRQDITMDLFSNAVFPFTVAASIAVITGFFHASGVSLNSDGDRVSFQKIGIEPIPIMSLMTMIFGIFATAGFSIRYFASPTVRTGHLCSLSFILALVLTYVLLRPTANNSRLQSHRSEEHTSELQS